MGRRWTVIVFFLFFAYLAQSQNKKDFKDLVEAGDFYYQKELFSKASELYSQANQIYPENGYCSFQLAECYRKTYKYEAASKYYMQTADLDVINFPTAIYYQSLMLKLRGRFAEAIDWFDAFLTLTQLRDFEDREVFADQAVIEKEGCYLALKHVLEPAKNYHFVHLESPLNSDFNDFAASIYLNDSSLVLTSGRMEATGSSLDYRFGEAFTDNFRYSKYDKGWIAHKANDKFGRINSKRSDGAGFFNQARDKFYFTSCKDPSGGHCRIYVTNLINGEWQDPEELSKNINLHKTESKHPTLSTGEDTLFFVSNREGGSGGLDIWMSITADEDLWGPAINLGDRINTPYDEVSPFYDSKRSRLFFASNGHVGFGGMDIFMVKGDVFQYADIVNLGPEFNSNWDEGYLALGEQLGYLSSNRSGGLGNFDIYQFKIHSLIRNLERDQSSAGRSRILRSRRIKVSGSDVAAVQDQDQLYYETLEGEERELFDRLIQYEAVKNEYFSGAQLSLKERGFYNSLSSQENKILNRFASKKLGALNPRVKNTCRLASFRSTPDADYQNITITGNVYDEFDQKAAENLTISLSDAAGRVLKIASTDEKGEFKFFSLRLNQTYNLILENCSGMESVYSIKDLTKLGYNPSDVITDIEDIYFDFNQYSLRPESKMVLADLVEYYGENRGIQIEIFAHTDSVGSSDFNLELSRKRGKSAYNFLTEMGISKVGIVIWAIGRHSPLANNSTALGRQFNRRVEFIINGQTKPFHSTCRTFITRNEVNLPDLSREIGVPVNTLKEINGMTDDLIEAFKPIRITTGSAIDNLPADQFYMDPFTRQVPNP